MNSFDSTSPERTQFTAEFLSAARVLRHHRLKTQIYIVLGYMSQIYVRPKSYFAASTRSFIRIPFAVLELSGKSLKFFAY